jgi:paraquat-inducible protein B
LNATHKFIPELPRAKIKRQATRSLIWAVPIIAAIAAGVLVFQNVRKIGPAITIQFEDGTGLAANQTVIRYRGVRVGSVNAIQLSHDTKSVAVRARLDRSASGLAREGTVFWIVRPEVSAAGVRSLETIVSGPYIQAMPGEGRRQKDFVGADEPPIITQPGRGARFVLLAPQVRSLGPSSPVFYRGLQAGKVEYLELSRDSTRVKVHVQIKSNFAPLIRTNTVWWNAGGINVDYHLLLRFSMTAENLRAIITGGVAFATPDEPGGPAPSGFLFPLYEKSDDKWLSWSPQIELTNATVSVPPATGALDLNSAGNNGNQSQK